MHGYGRSLRIFGTTRGAPTIVAQVRRSNQGHGTQLAALSTMQLARNREESARFGSMVSGPTPDEPDRPDRYVAAVEKPMRLGGVERDRVPRGQVVALKANLDTQGPRNDVAVLASVVAHE